MIEKKLIKGEDEQKAGGPGGDWSERVEGE